MNNILLTSFLSIAIFADIFFHNYGGYCAVYELNEEFKKIKTVYQEMNDLISHIKDSLTHNIDNYIDIMNKIEK